MTDREIMHKLLDEILDTGNMSAIYTEFFPGIPGKIVKYINGKRI